MRTMLCLVCTLAMPLTATAADDIDDLSWMTGLWVQQQGGTVTEVIWSPPRGSTMVGTYRKLKEGEVQYYEILTMRSDAELTIEISSSGRLLGWSAFAGEPDSRMVGYDASPVLLTRKE